MYIRTHTMYEARRECIIVSTHIYFVYETTISLSSTGTPSRYAKYGPPEAHGHPECAPSLVDALFQSVWVCTTFMVCTFTYSMCSYIYEPTLSIQSIGGTTVYMSMSMRPIMAI